MPRADVHRVSETLSGPSTVVEHKRLFAREKK